MSDAAAVANNTFGFKLLAELRKDRPRDNIFISPLSVMLALAMTANGAAGNTHPAMVRTLALDGLSEDQTNQAVAALVTRMSGGPQVRLSIANALWGDRRVTFDDDFLRRCHEFFHAELAALDFGSAASVERINRWVSDQTNGKIPAIIDRLNPGDALVLTNAIYFKGAWTRTFDKAQTEERPFTLLNGQQKQHPLMRQSQEFSYYGDRAVQLVRLPYGDGKLSMYIALPGESSSLDAFLHDLDAPRWEALVRQMRKRKGSVTLPRFKLEYRAQLKDALKDMGMGDAFKPGADFSRMTPPSQREALMIGEVIHRTFVEVNEEGTEAAAATAVMMTRASFIPEQAPFNMVVDRPFFCAIRDDRSNALLFAGAIVEPK